MTEPIHIFDRALVRRHRDRAAAAFSQRHSALHGESSALLLERIDDVKRGFANMLDLGAHDGFLAKHLARRQDSFVVAADISGDMLRQSASFPHVAADEEFLPFADASFDLVVSNLSLHWVNDLPGALAQIKKALRPDGLFLAALLGGHTLHELRACLLEAELVVAGGISPRLSPSIDMPTASALLQRAGFSLPVTDEEVITFTYPDIFALMRDLRGMGETNAHIERSRIFTRRRIFELAGQLYKERFARADGRIPATFELIFIHGWH